MDRLPDWLTRPAGPEGVPAPSARGAEALARRGLGAVVRTAAALLAPGAEPDRESWLVRLDARVKIAGFMLLLVTATLVRSLPALLACAACAWAVAALGGVRMRRFSRALLTLSLVTSAIALPATLNLVTEGKALLVLGHLRAGSWGPWRWSDTLAITDRGLFVAARFLLRSLACIALGLLVAASTKPRDLFGGLRGLGVPATFVFVLDMMVRYLALLLRSAEEIHLAKISRSIRRVPARKEQAWAAAGMGELYRKSRALAGEVGDAMVSRGFSGEVRSLSSGRWGWQETLFLFVTTLAAGGILLLGLGG